MAKQKHNPKSRHHKRIVGGILATALALMVVAAAQIGNTDTDLFKAQTMTEAEMQAGCVASGGTWMGMSAMPPCQMPTSGGTTSGYAAFTCPNGTSFPAGTGTPPTCPTTTNVVCPDGTSHPSPYTCPTTTTTTNTSCPSGQYWSGTACVNSTTATTTCGSGMWWDSYTNSCKSSTATSGTANYCPSGQWWDYSTNTCKSSTTSGTATTACGSGMWWDSYTNSCKSSTATSGYTADTVGACQGRGGVWTASTSTCSIAPGSSTYSGGYSGTASGTAYPAGTCSNGTSYPAGYGYPPCGTSTYTSGMYSGTSGYSGMTGGASQYVTSATCTSAGYFWGPKSNWCFNTKLEFDKGENMTGTYTQPVQTVDNCKNNGGTWNAGSSTCTYGTYSGMYSGTSGYSGMMTGGYTDSNPSQSCANAGGSWVADAASSNYNSGWCDMSKATSTYTQPYNQPWSTQWKNPASYGKDPEGCRNAGFYYDDSRKDCFPSKGDIYSLGNMMPGTFGPMPTTPFGPGMQSGFFDGGNFTPPTWDSQEMTDQYSQYGFEADNYQFDKFQIDWDQEYQGPQIQNRGQEVKRITKEGKQKLREITQFEKELERAKGRSGGNEACPAIANASAALSNAKAVIELMTNVTEDTLEQAMNAQGQLFGNWETQGIWNDVMQAIQGANQCEQLSQMQKDGGREVKQMTKELKRVRDAETKAFLEGVLAQFSDVVTNLGDYYVPCEGGFGPCDPMEEARFALDDLRMSFWDAMREQQEEFQYDDICGNFEMIREHLSEADDIPEDMLAKASALLNRGVAYCDAGNIDGASKVLRDMERMKNEFEGSFEGGEVEFGRNAEDYMREAAEFEFSDGEVDIDALMARMEERFLSKLETAVQAAVDRVTQAFTLQIAQMESAFASKLAEFQAAALDNVNIGFRGELKDAIIENKTEVAKAVADLDNVLVAFEGEDVEIPADVRAEITEIYEFATVHNMTAEASEEFKAEIDAATNEVIIAFQEDPDAAVETLADAVAELRDAGERIYEGDKDAQLEAGILPFVDLHGMEDDWTFGWAAAARNEGFVNGQVVDGERVMNAGADTNWAEGLTMTARMVAGGEDNIPNEVDLADPVVREMPDWAQASVTYLMREGRISSEDLHRVYGNSNPGDAITRIELTRVLSDAADLPVEEDVSLNFPDTGRLGKEDLDAARALVGAGIMNGEGDGRFNPEGTANRAAFSKMIIGTLDAARAAGTLEFPTPPTSIEGDGESFSTSRNLPDPTGGRESLIDPTFDEEIPSI